MSVSEAEVPLRLMQLLASRLCHDLIGPLGAIANGVEIIDDAGDGGGPFRDEALGIIADSSAKAAVVLKFYRAAHGGAGDGLGRDGWGETLDLAVPYLEARKLALDLPAPETLDTFATCLAPDATVPAPGRAARLLLNGLASIALLLPVGGRIGLTSGAGGGLVVAGSGRVAKLPPAWAQALAGDPAAPPDASTAQFHFLALLARVAGLTVHDAQHLGDSVSFGLVPRAFAR